MSNNNGGAPVMFIFILLFAAPALWYAMQMYGASRDLDKEQPGRSAPARR